MGFIFQLCDRSLSKALEVEPVAYGEEPNPNPNPSNLSLSLSLSLTLSLSLSLTLALTRRQADGSSDAARHQGRRL